MSGTRDPPRYREFLRQEVWSEGSARVERYRRKKYNHGLTDFIGHSHCDVDAGLSRARLRSLHPVNDTLFSVAGGEPSLRTVIVHPGGSRLCAHHGGKILRASDVRYFVARCIARSSDCFSSAIRGRTPPWEAGPASIGPMAMRTNRSTSTPKPSSIREDGGSCLHPNDLQPTVSLAAHAVCLAFLDTKKLAVMAFDSAG